MAQEQIHRSLNLTYWFDLATWGEFARRWWSRSLSSSGAMLLFTARRFCTTAPLAAAATPTIPAKPTNFHKSTRIYSTAPMTGRKPSLNKPLKHSSSSIPFAEALEDAATGDVWLFRGKTPADRTIRWFTNSPVNHVGVVLALEDLPPLLWHAEMGASVPNVWSGKRERGAQLHHLEHAVSVWHHKYGQSAWFRQITIEDQEAIPAMEDKALSVVSEFSGRSFPNTKSLAVRWVKGQVKRDVPLVDIYCAELVAVTLERMGLLAPGRPANWYDPGRFWSGDELQLQGASLAQEVRVQDITPMQDHWFEADS